MYTQQLNRVNSKASQIPSILEELESQIELASQDEDAKTDFFNWYNTWYKDSSNVIDESVKNILSLEEEALTNPSKDLNEKQAVKDALELEEVVQKIGSQLGNISKSIEMDLKFSHLWKFWNCKVKPSKSKLNTAIRKFKIACAGL